MKLLIAVVMLCMCNPGLALDSESRNRRSLSNVFGYFTDVDIKTTTDFNLHMMDYQHFVNWMDNLVAGFKSIVGGPYMPSNDEVEHIVGCYFHRYWQRKHVTDLTEDEEFCKRLSENKPNAIEKRDSHRYEALLEMWDSMKQVDKIQFGPYNLTEGEKIEIEECHFYRSWEREIVTEHDLFCKRLSENMPNRIESLERVAFETYRDEWKNMSAVASKDFAQVTVCVLVERKLLREPRERPCKGYPELILNRNTWRDIRREQIHQCMHQALKTKRTPQCTEIVKRYKKVYCRNDC